MPIEDIINEDEKIELQLTELSKRTDYYNPKFWIENQRVLNRYRAQRVNELVTEYHWSRKIATKISKFIHPPTKKITAADCVIGYVAGSLPKRYLGPIAKIRGKDISVYTKISIITDALLLGVSAFVVYNMHTDHKSELTTQIYNFLNSEGPAAIIYANAVTRAVQLCTRTKAYLNGKHTWSPTSIITPLLLEIPPYFTLLAFDQVQKIKEYKHNSVDSNKGFKNIIRDKRYLNAIME